MSFRLEVLQDVLKVEVLTIVELKREDEWKISEESKPQLFSVICELEQHLFCTYMGVLLVKLWVAVLQNVIWVADVFFDRHGLCEVHQC